MRRSKMCSSVPTVSRSRVSIVPKLRFLTSMRTEDFLRERRCVDNPTNCFDVGDRLVQRLDRTETISHSVSLLLDCSFTRLRWLCIRSTVCSVAKACQPNGAYHHTSSTHCEGRRKGVGEHPEPWFQKRHVLAKRGWCIRDILFHSSSGMRIGFSDGAASFFLSSSFLPDVTVRAALCPPLLRFFFSGSSAAPFSMARTDRDEGAVSCLGRGRRDGGWHAVQVVFHVCLHPGESMFGESMVQCS